MQHRLLLLLASLFCVDLFVAGSEAEGRELGSILQYAALNQSCLSTSGMNLAQCQALQKLWFLSNATDLRTSECMVPWGNPPNPVKWLGDGCKTCPFKKNDPQCANFHDDSGGCKLWCDCMSIKCKSSCDQNNYGCYWLQQGNLPGLCLNRPKVLGCSGPICAANAKLSCQNTDQCNKRFGFGSTCDMATACCGVGR